MQHSLLIQKQGSLCPPDRFTLISDQNYQAEKHLEVASRDRGRHIPAIISICGKLLELKKFIFSEHVAAGLLLRGVFAEKAEN
jgi:hypothetical protein